MLLIVFGTITCKSQSIDCGTIFKDSIDEVIGTPEVAPLPIGGLQMFYEGIRSETLNSRASGKVFVQFVVDTLGDVKCARILKSDNELLNDLAISLIKQTKFLPAMNRRRRIPAQMVLPITFGN